MKDKILIIDDTLTNRELLAEMVPEGYDVLFGETGLDAIDLAQNNTPNTALMLLDLLMPKMDGFKALRIIKSNPATKDIIVMVITSESSTDIEAAALAMGATDFITKPFHATVVKSRISSKLEMWKYSRYMNDLIMEKVHKIDSMQNVVIDLLASMVECREADSIDHIKHTRALTTLFLSKLLAEGKLEGGFTADELEFVSKIVVLHDIGKIAIPDKILLKPGRLSQDEFEIIKTHTTRGFEITSQMGALQDAKYLRYVQDICLYHHEKWDGTGYPCGIKGKKIPFMARVTAIVDVYDAMMSKRVYKDAYTHKQTIEFMYEQKGKHFDPELIEVFYKYNKDFGAIRE